MGKIERTETATAIFPIVPRKTVDETREGREKIAWAPWIEEGCIILPTPT
jgi:hypothetical protein